MLNQLTVIPTIAVTDLAAAREFYGEVLGLAELEESAGGITFESGEGVLFVYQSAVAGSNKATYASWRTHDIEPVLRDLKERGVDFEHYDDIPGMTRDGDVHSMGTMKALWFCDPDGNILNVTAMQ